MEPKVSERFPAEYGDISLQSCDGVICHFPKSVLSYASKHFRGIFHPLPSADQDDLFRRVTLVVTEKAEILEAFLDLIDPSTVSPQMSARTVRDIVEAARKYDVPVIFHWFQREVNLRYYDLSSHQTTEPFLLSNPLMALSIAVEHNLEKIGKMAVTELLGCTSEHVDIANVGVPVEIRDRIREFRYGDFVLKSSDGVVFHFSRSILAYMSDFFRGMFELPATEKNQGTARNPLVLTEAAAVIEVFLQQIDPKNPTPTIDHDTVIGLLEMARKYQVQTIFDRFQIMMRRERDQYTGLLFSRPLAVLYIALQHDLEMVGKWALQELMQCSSRYIENDEVEIPAKTFQYIHRLRRERLRKLQAYIDVITKSNTSADPPSVTKCARCSTLRSELLLHLERSIEKKPNWSTFNGICILAPDKKCPQCRKVKPGLIDVPKSQYAQWAKEMRDLEKSLPSWPIAYLT
ncbi:hypothetical protein FRC17_011071 [Serendipita sp. 399]|nr:hypothetical protein FRC17_011071 [Serendipita sp. 399]